METWREMIETAYGVNISSDAFSPVQMLDAACDFLCNYGGIGIARFSVRRIHTAKYEATIEVKSKIGNEVWDRFVSFGKTMDAAATILLLQLSSSYYAQRTKHAIRHMHEQELDMSVEKGIAENIAGFVRDVKKDMDSADEIKEESSHTTTHVDHHALGDPHHYRFTDYVIGAARTYAPISSNEPELFRQRCVAILGLAGEAGEMADMWKKHIGHDHVLDFSKIREELGDILFYIAYAAAAFDMDLAKVAQDNIQKLRERYPSGFDPEISKARATSHTIYGTTETGGTHTKNE